MRKNKANSQVMPDGTTDLSVFVEANKGLVFDFVYKHVSRLMSRQDPALDLDDFVQEVFLGFLLAVRRFEPTKGKFSTYAWWWFKQSYYQLVYHSGQVVIPNVTWPQVGEYMAMVKELENKLGCSPSDEQLSQALDWKQTKLQRVKKAYYASRRLMVDVSTTEGIELVGTVTVVEEEMEKVWKRQLLVATMNRMLDVTERSVLQQRMDGKTYQEIAELCHYTRQGIQQLEKRALLKLKKALAGKISPNSG